MRRSLSWHGWQQEISDYDSPITSSRFDLGSMVSSMKRECDFVNLLMEKESKEAMELNCKLNDLAFEFKSKLESALRGLSHTSETHASFIPGRIQCVEMISTAHDKLFEVETEQLKLLYMLQSDHELSESIRKEIALHFEEDLIERFQTASHHSSYAPERFILEALRLHFQRVRLLTIDEFAKRACLMQSEFERNVVENSQCASVFADRDSALTAKLMKLTDGLLSEEDATANTYYNDVNRSTESSQEMPFFKSKTPRAKSLTRCPMQSPQEDRIISYFKSLSLLSQTRLLTELKLISSESKSIRRKSSKECDNVAELFANLSLDEQNTTSNEKFDASSATEHKDVSSDIRAVLCDFLMIGTIGSASDDQILQSLSTWIANYRDGVPATGDICEPDSEKRPQSDQNGWNHCESSQNDAEGLSLLIPSQMLEIEDLRERLLESDDKYRKIEGEKSLLRMRVEELEAILREEEKKSSEVAASAVAAENRSAAISSELESLKAEKSKLLEDAHTHEDVIRLEEENANMRFQLEQMSTAHELRYKKLSDSFSEKEQMVAKLQSDLVAANESLFTAKNDLEDSRCCNEDLQQIIDSLKERCNQFETSQSEEGIKLQTQLELNSRLQNELDSCKVAFDSLRVEFTAKTADNESLKAESDQNELKINALEEENATLQSDLRANENSLRELHDKLEKSLETEQKLAATKEILEAELLSSRNELTIQCNLTEQLRIQLKRCEDLNSLKTTEIANLTQELKLAALKREEKEKEINEARSLMEELERNMHSLRDELMTKSEECDTYRSAADSCSEIQLLFETCQEDLRNKDHLLKEAASHLNVKEDEIAELKKQVQSYSSSFEENDGRSKYLTGEIQRKECLLAEANEKQESLQSKIDELLKENSEFELKAAKFESDFNNCVSEIETQTQVNQKLQQLLKDQHQISESKLETIRKESLLQITALRSGIHELGVLRAYQRALLRDGTAENPQEAAFEVDFADESQKLAELENRLDSLEHVFGSEVISRGAAVVQDDGEMKAIRKLERVPPPCDDAVSRDEQECQGRVCRAVVKQLQERIAANSATDAAIIDRKCREIQEVNELVKLLKTDLEKLKRENESVACSYDTVAATLSEVARIQLETLRMIAEDLDPIAENCEELYTPVNRVRTSQEIANWELEFESPTRRRRRKMSPISVDATYGGDTCGGHDGSFNSSNVSDLSQYLCESTAAAVANSLQPGAEDIVLRSSKELKEYVAKLSRHLSSFRAQSAENKKSEELLKKVGSVVESLLMDLGVQRGNERLDDADEDFSRIEHSVRQLQEEVRKQSREMDGLRENAELVKVLESSNSELRQSVASRAEETSRLREELQQLLQRNSQLMAAQQQLKTNEEDLLQLRTQHEEAQKEAQLRLEQLRDELSAQHEEALQSLESDSNQRLELVRSELREVQHALQSREQSFEEIRQQLRQVLGSLSDDIVADMTSRAVAAAQQEMSVEAMFESLSGMIEENRKRVAELTENASSVEQLQISNSDLTQQLQNKSEQIDHLSDQVQSLQAATSQLEQIKNTLEEKQQEVHNLRTSLERQKEENENVLRLVKTDLETAHREIVKMRDESATSQKCLQEEIDRLKFSVDEKEALLDAVQKRVDETMRMVHEMSVTTKEGEVGETSSVEERIAQLQETVSTLVAQLHELKGVAEDVDGLRESNAQLTADLEANAEQLKRLQAEFKLVDVRNHHLTENKLQLEGKISSMQRSLEKASLDLEGADERISGLSQQIDLEREQMQLQLQNQIRAVEQHKDDELQEFKKQVQNLKDELTQSNKYVTEISMLRDASEETLKEQEKLSARLSDSEKQAREAVRHLEQANARIEELEKECQTVKSEKADLNKQKEALQSSNASLEKRCAEVEAERLKLKQQFDAALRRMSLPSLSSPLELPSRETIRDESMAVTRTPAPIDFGSSFNLNSVERKPDSQERKSSRHDSPLVLNTPPTVTKDEEEIAHLVDAVYSPQVQSQAAHDLTFINESLGGVASSSTPLAAGNRSAHSDTVPVETLDRLKLSWENEKSSLLSVNRALKDLISQCNRIQQGVHNSEDDWRLELIRAIEAVFKNERDALLNETVSHAISTTNLHLLPHPLHQLNSKIQKMTRVVQEGLSSVKVADRVSLINELKELRQQVRLHDAVHAEQERLIRASDDAGKIFSRLEDRLKSVETELTSERLKNSDLMVSVQVESSRAKEVQHERERLSQENSRLVSELARAQANIEASNARSAANGVDRLDPEERRGIQETLMSLKNHHAQNVSLIENLRRELAREKERCEAYQVEAESSRKYSVELAEELNRLENETISKLQDRISLLQAQLSATENSLKDKSACLLSAQSSISELNQKNETLTTESNKLRSRVSKSTDKVKELEKRERELQKKLASKEAEVRSHEKSQRSDRSQREAEITSREGTIARLRRELEERGLEVERSHAEREKLQRQVHSILEDVDRCKLQLQRMDQKELSHQQERKNLYDLVEEQKAAITRLEKENLIFSSKYSKSQSELSGCGDMRSPGGHSDAGKSHSARNIPSLQPDHVRAYQQHVESVRENIQIIITRFLETVQLFNSYQESEQLSMETKHIINTGKKCLSEIQSVASKYLILPEKSSSAKNLLDLNERLIKQNRDLTDLAGLITNEKVSLRHKLQQTGEQLSSKSNDELQVQKLYGAFLRSENRRKNLQYQKRYLLLLIEGFREYEESALQMISQIGAAISDATHCDRKWTNGATASGAKRRFKGAVRAVIAVYRMRQLVEKWRRIANPTIPKQIHMDTVIATPHSFPNLPSPPTKDSAAFQHGDHITYSELRTGDTASGQHRPSRVDSRTRRLSGTRVTAPPPPPSAGQEEGGRPGGDALVDRYRHKLHHMQKQLNSIRVVKSP